MNGAENAYLQVHECSHKYDRHNVLLTIEDFDFLAIIFSLCTSYLNKSTYAAAADVLESNEL